MKYPPVLTKADFVRRYQLGEFGNRSPTWDNCDSFIQWGCRNFKPHERIPHLFHLRNRVAGGPTYYNLEWSATIAKWSELPDRKSWYVSMMAPTEQTLIQGEVQIGYGGLDLYFSRVRLPMRDALRAESRSISGLAALLTLNHYLCPNSRDWLYVLLERYPGHVVEFSSYQSNWGTLPNFNTVFWEVRLY